MSGDPFDDVRAVADPTRRARAATELLAIYQQRSAELARLRREAIDELQSQGMSYAEVATLVGLSKARIGQIKLAAPSLARALFGVGPVQVWTPARATKRTLPVVATEDALTAQAVTRLLDALGLASEQRHVPPDDDEWTPTGDHVVICGPKTHRQAAEWIAADPVLDLTKRGRRWAIVDRVSGDVQGSGLDDEPTRGQDLAYISRRHIGRTVRWHIAGIHAIGSLGAATWISEHADHLWADHGDHSYSVAVRSTHDGATIISTEQATEVLRHDR